MTSLDSGSQRCRHIALFYDSAEQRNAKVADCISQGLKEGQLCIYASAGAHDGSSPWNIDNLVSKMTDYSENVESGDLMVIDIQEHIESAIKSDSISYLEVLSSEIENMVKMRIEKGRGRRVLLIGDGAGSMAERNRLDLSLKVEAWWHHQQSVWAGLDLDITTICPHFVAAAGAQSSHIMDKIALAHNHIIYAANKSEARAQTKPIRVLVVEPEQDIQSLYKRYLQSLNLQVLIAGSGGECIRHAFDECDPGFDLIILDSHIRDRKAAEVAKMIREAMPDQKIVITSTLSRGDLDPELVNISRGNVLQKPFRFRNLLAFIEPAD